MVSINGVLIISQVGQRTKLIQSISPHLVSRFFEGKYILYRIYYIICMWSEYRVEADRLHTDTAWEHVGPQLQLC